MSHYAIDTFGQLQPHVQREWLLTNGLGGFAMGSVVGCNTRRYHGLLCAATNPPVGRVLALSRLGEILTLDGNRDRLLEFSVNQFGDGYHPRGDRYLRRFELDDTARWEYDVEGVSVVKELQVPWLANVVGIRYTVTAEPGRQGELSLLPFAALRDFHGTRHADGSEMPKHVHGERHVAVEKDGQTLDLAADAGRWVAQPSWWYGHTFQIELERGFNDTEDLFNPGRFVLPFTGSGSITVWAAVGAPAEGRDWDALLRKRRGAVGGVCKVLPKLRAEGADTPAVACEPTSTTVKRLVRAANDFVVYRKAPDGSDGTSVIAGYPWFADWGRDTFISMPGLLLITGRFEQAKQVLKVFAEYVSDGMIPNRFNDYTNEPEYNTVDASLWFVHSAFEYYRRSRDTETFETVLLPACRKIVEGYRDGTRYNIKMDPADGLVIQGDEHTQLTWMDAKCNGVAFTPRQGKPVEINALWYHALTLLGQKELAARVAESFRTKFWISPFRGLVDVVGNDGSRDASVRPNQIFAVSLPNSPLTRPQQQSVVEVVRRELLTPFGLRTLAKGDPKYCGRYCGGPWDRDKAYHNGTVWPWPIGAFLEAYLKVHDHGADAVAQARRWLSPLIDHLETDGCVGQISEVFEADEPHRQGGCCAQAWSVAEVLRLAVELEM